MATMLFLKYVRYRYLLNIRVAVSGLALRLRLHQYDADLCGTDFTKMMQLDPDRNIVTRCGLHKICCHRFRINVDMKEISRNAVLVATLICSIRIVKLNKTEDDVLEDTEISPEELKQLADQV
jgi:hypothetical protein